MAVLSEVLERQVVILGVTFLLIEDRSLEVMQQTHLVELA